MGLRQSNINNNIKTEITAERLWMMESAKKGVQAIGWTLISPFVVIACPIIGAYEFGSRLQEELLTGSYVIDGTLGFLFGVVASPLAPFFVMWQSMEALFGSPPPLRPSVEYMDHARQVIGLDTDKYYNVAIVGSPGTGKSTLLNGLLGYKDNHEKAAQVCEANHNNNDNNRRDHIKPRGYNHPILRTLMIWDMPSVVIHHGMRTKHYFHKHFLGAFDALLIVSAERLMATDIKLARKAIEFGVPVFFIRNKADAAIDSKLRKMNANISLKKSSAEKWALAVAQLTEEVDSTYCRNMRNFGFKTETLYIISSWTLQDFIVSLIEHKLTDNLRLIHEKLLILNLIDTITEHRRKKLITASEQLKEIQPQQSIPIT